MVCLLCLKKKSKLIKISSKKGKKLNCSQIIAKHFWFSLNTLESSKESVCLDCWDVVQNFNFFYQSVAEAHSFFETADINLNISEKSNGCDPIPTPLNSEEINPINLFEPVVKVEANCLNILTQTEAIENTKIKYESTSTENNLYIESYSYKHTEHETHSSLADDSETEPLSKLLCSQTEKQFADTNKTSVNDVFPTEFDSSFNEMDTSIIENSSACSNKRNSNSDSDYEPEECADMNKNAPKKIKKLNLKHLQQKKEYDKNIADFFEKLNCSKCELSYSNFDDLRKHAKIAHECSKMSIECCGRKFFMRKTLSDHALLHLHPEYLKCSYTNCDKIFPENLQLKEHEKTHKNVYTDTKFFHCDQCPKTFAAKNNLKAHQLVMHLPKSEYKFQCTECDEKFPTTRRYKDHMRSAHGLENPLICEKCGKRTRNTYSLKRHMIKHSDDPWPNPVQCDICGKWLKQSNSLRQHKTWVHKRVTEEKCLICNKTFSNIRYLESHIFYKHRDERKFQCTMCDKAFKRERDLKTHTNLHTKEMVFTCELCLKTFNQKTSLLKHKSNFHLNNQVKAPDPVQCNICSAWLKTISGLKSHIKIVHEGSVGEHRCNICGSKSVNAFALRRHLKRNHGVKSNQREMFATIQQNQNATAEVTT